MSNLPSHAARPEESMKAFMMLEQTHLPFLKVHGGGGSFVATMPPLEKEITVSGIHFESENVSINTPIDPPITCLQEESGTWRLHQDNNKWELEYVTETQYGRLVRNAGPIRWPIDPNTVMQRG